LKSKKPAEINSTSLALFLTFKSHCFYLTVSQGYESEVIDGVKVFKLIGTLSSSKLLNTNF